MGWVLECRHSTPCIIDVLCLNVDYSMTTTEPNIPETGKYNVTETCALLGIHRNTLERYRKSLKIRCGIRMTTGRKYYTGREIKRLWRGV